MLHLGRIDPGVQAVRMRPRSVPAARRTAFVMHLERGDTRRLFLFLTRFQPGQQCANSLTMVQLAVTVLVEPSAIAIPF